MFTGWLGDRGRAKPASAINPSAAFEEASVLLERSSAGRAARDCQNLELLLLRSALSHSAALHWISLIDNYLFLMANADRKFAVDVFFFKRLLTIISHLCAPEANKINSIIVAKKQFSLHIPIFFILIIISCLLYF